MRANPPGQRFIAVDEIVADTVRCCMLRDGASIPVEPRIMELFVYLARAAGRIVSKRELMERVWRAHVVDEAIHRAISMLRTALGDFARNSLIIETVPRHGYRLRAHPRGLDRLDTASPPAPRRALLTSGRLALALVALFLLWQAVAVRTEAPGPETALVLPPRTAPAAQAPRAVPAPARAAAPISRPRPDTPVARPEAAMEEPTPMASQPATPVAYAPVAPRADEAIAPTPAPAPPRP